MLKDQKKPSWLKVAPPTGENYFKLKKMSKDLSLSTVCQEARCPNIEECWKNRTATFMILGDTCTRGCRFCAVKTGDPKKITNENEPKDIAKAVKTLNLKYVVLTSVDRDDLEDQGANQFIKTVNAIKKDGPDILIELLTPDFSASPKLISSIVTSKPDVFGHNLETVRRLTPDLRDRRASYDKSLETLKIVKEYSKDMITKSSLMLGVGEKHDEILQAMDDLLEVGTNVITFGQYLSPTKKHYPVMEYITPEKFKELEKIAIKKGFLYCASGPLVRSSYNAGKLFLKHHLNNRI